MAYLYCLRYVLDPRTNTEKKNKALLDFVKKGQIDDVCFILNGEEINHSHLTASETEFWLDAVRPLQKKLKQLGVTTSLNPWTTIMHSDRGFKVNPEIGFHTFVDINGDQAKDMACPADPIWRKYLCARYAQYASIHPRRLWMEDDFRHYNHTPLKLMCFCPYHMKIYQAKLGKKENRAEFVKQMLKPGEPTPERKVYLDQARKEMIEVEHLVEQAVHQVSPETDLAQMTSFPDWHAIEGRDWAGLFDAQRGAGHPRVARPHLPAYNEVSSIQYGRDFESYSRITAAYLGPDAVLLPEQENAMWTPMVKSKKFIAFQIITTALLGAQGVMLNLFDMMGNGVSPEWKYGEMLAEIKPFLNKLLEHRLNLTNLAGIKVLVDQDSAYSIHTREGKAPEEMLPVEKEWAALLSSCSFATTITPVQHGNCDLENETIAIAGQLLRNLSDEEITSLIEKNTVLLDGESIQVLLDRNLGSLIGVTQGEWHACKTGYQSFEEADGITVDEVENPRITMLQHTGDYLQLTYAKDANVKIWSNAINSIDQKLGPMMSIVDDHILLLPMSHDVKHGWESQYSTYKQGLLQQMMSSVENCDYLVDMPNVKLNISSDRKVMWISNFSLDTYDEIKWHFAQKPSAKAVLIKQNGDKVSKEELTIEGNDGVAAIPVKLNPLETVQILFVD
jgi:hypothetical protein